MITEFTAHKGITWKGLWSPAYRYSARDLVRYNDKLYLAGNTSLNEAPDTNIVWEIVSSNQWTYVHTQLSPATVWVVNHGLNGYPSVTIVDSADSVVEGSVDYIDQNNIRLTFIGAFSGRAFFS